MKQILFVAFVFTIVLSCSKEKSEPMPAEAASYAPLTIGSYWVYSHFKINSFTGEEEQLEIVDSVVVVGDTVINSETYSVFYGTRAVFSGRGPGIISLLRDSSGFLIDNEGKVHFATNFPQQVLRTDHLILDGGDTIYTVNYTMEDVKQEITAPAGQFITLNFKGELIDNVHENPRYLNNYFAEGVGKVIDTYFYIAQNEYYFERRLKKYHIAD